MHRVQGHLQQDKLQGLQAQGSVQEELQEITFRHYKKQQVPHIGEPADFLVANHFI
jgi:hypothetical protein